MKLIIQPESGVVPIVHAIKSARKWIDILIFRFDRVEIEKALTAAVQGGVKVRARSSGARACGRTNSKIAARSD